VITLSHEGADIGLCLRPDPSGAPVGPRRPKSFQKAPVAGREKAEAILPHAGAAEEGFDFSEELSAHERALCTL
jgi:hypothetical protein